MDLFDLYLVVSADQGLGCERSTYCRLGILRELIEMKMRWFHVLVRNQSNPGSLLSSVKATCIFALPERAFLLALQLLAHHKRHLRFGYRGEKGIMVMA